MQTALTSAAVVFLAEMGDKTQLLAIVLAARFRRPAPIILGIFAATLLNHAAAAAAGYFAAGALRGPTVQIVIGLLFIVMAAWALVPDAADEKVASRPRGGVFLTSLVAFFLVEMGDKTQIATSLLAARFHDMLGVTVGTTLGMMAANAPAVLFGQAVTRIVPLRYVRAAAAIVFAIIGAVAVAAALRAL